MIYEGKPQPVPPAAGKNVNVAGSVVLGKEMLPGDYVMQIVVTDKLAKEKYNTAGQFVQFEIVD